MNRDTVDKPVAALIVGLSPEGGVLQGNVAHRDVAALTEVNELGTVSHAPQLERVADNAVGSLGQEVVGQLATAAVYHALASNGDTVLTVGQDECIPRVELHVVIVGISGAHQDGALAEMQGNLGTQVDAASKIAAHGKHQTATALLGYVVDGALDGAGIHRNPVRLDAEEGHLIVLGRCGHGRYHQHRQGHCS